MIKYLKTNLENVMKKKSSLLFLISAVCFVLFLVFTVLVAVCDKGSVAYDEAGKITSVIGFVKLNQSVFNALGTNDLWYEFTEFLGTIAIGTAAIFAMIGIGQLAKRKSIWAVDREILLLAALYILIVLFYLFFEVVVLNYRPILVGGGFEASYPSSHTMLACCIFVTAPFACQHLIKASGTHSTVSLLCFIFAPIMVVGRLLAGVHWLTDIIGSLLLSASLVLLYIASITLLNEKAPHKKQHSHR